MRDGSLHGDGYKPSLLSGADGVFGKLDKVFYFDVFNANVGFRHNFIVIAQYVGGVVGVSIPRGREI